MLVVVLLIIFLPVDEFNPDISYSRFNEFIYDAQLSNMPDGRVEVTFRIEPDDCQK